MFQRKPVIRFKGLKRLKNATARTIEEKKDRAAKRKANGSGSSSP